MTEKTTPAITAVPTGEHVKPILLRILSLYAEIIAQHDPLLEQFKDNLSGPYAKALRNLRRIERAEKATPVKTGSGKGVSK